MKVLIIGGTRFFGRRLVHLLLEQGHDVSIITRGNQTDDFGNRVQRLRANRTIKAELEQAVKAKSFDVVVDQVCMTGQEARDAIDIFKDKTTYYLLTSTMSVYEQKANLRESDFRPAEFLPDNSNSYASGKREAEKEFLEQTYFKNAAARFPVVLGTDDYTERLLNQVRRVQNGKPIFYPNLKAKFSFISSQDAAASLLWLLTHRHIGAFNFASEEVLALEQLISLIEQETGKKALLSNAPSEENFSPFGIDQDWYLNVEKAKAMGFKAQDLSLWLPQLLNHYVTSFTDA